MVGKTKKNRRGGARVRAPTASAPDRYRLRGDRNEPAGVYCADHQRLNRTVPSCPCVGASEDCSHRVFGLAPRVGFRARVEALRTGLRDLGWIEGANIVIEFRWAQRVEQLPDLAGELVQMNVDIIFAPSSTFVEAARKATQTIPIVHRVRAQCRSRRPWARREPRSTRREHYRADNAVHRAEHQATTDIEGSRAVFDSVRRLVEPLDAVPQTRLAGD